LLIIGVMIQLNNKHFRHAGGYSQGLRIPSVSSAPGESIKDDTMNNYKTLKGTDWKITPTGHYVRIINGEKALISRFYGYTSRKGNNYKTCYRVQLGDKYLGQRNSFKDAISLAVGGQS